MGATHCNFCGRHAKYVRKLIVAVDRFNNNKEIGICDECLNIALEEVKKSDESTD